MAKFDQVFGALERFNNAKYICENVWPNKLIVSLLLGGNLLDVIIATLSVLGATGITTEPH